VSVDNPSASSSGQTAVLPLFNRNELLDMAVARSDEYQSAKPYPHIAIDNFLPDDIVRELISAFPGPEDVVWRSYNSATELKLALEDEMHIPMPHLQVLRELNSQLMVEFLEELTGISGLIPDPSFRGGGLHQILPGGMLKIHADFNLHQRMHVRRRLNAILYLNEEWDESYGGALELWDKSMSAAVTSVDPLANRLVVFSTTDHSFHGHPDPLACPTGRSRQSMAWYYYTASDTDRSGHTTLFMERPGETLTSRQEKLKARASAAVPESVKRAVRRLM
jgi:hypothetical protein